MLLVRHVTQLELHRGWNVSSKRAISKRPLHMRTNDTGTLP